MPSRPIAVKPRRAIAIALAFVALATFLAFLPALQNDFAGSWDDDTNLINNPYFRGLGWTQLRWMWTSHLMQHYVPLAWMSFGFDYLIWGMDPFGYHLTNVLLHACNAALVLVLAMWLMKLDAPPYSNHSSFLLLQGATFAALVFGLHPLRVESVAWATERRDVLSGLFYIAALLAYLRAFGDQPSQKKYYWLSLGLFVAAVLSKEVAVTLPAVLLILDVYPLRRLVRQGGSWSRTALQRCLAEKLPFFAVTMADSAMTIIVAFRHHLPDSFATLGWIPRIAITVYGMAFYVLKTVAPIRLSPLYPLTDTKLDPLGVPFLTSLALVLVITLAAIALRRKLPALLAVWLAYAVTLLPMGGIIHNGDQIAADRYSYLSCIGWAILAGAAVRWWIETPRAGRAMRSLTAALLVALPAILVRQTWSQTRIWRDAETLWTRAIEVEPSPVALCNLGTALFHRGDLPGAEARFRRAIAINPRYGPAHNNLGGALVDQRRYEEAIQEFLTAHQLAPSAPEPYNGMGNALLLQGKYDQAIAQYRKVLELRPDYPGAEESLRQALALKNRPAL